MVVCMLVWCEEEKRACDLIDDDEGFLRGSALRHAGQRSGHLEGGVSGGGACVRGTVQGGRECVIGCS